MKILKKIDYAGGADRKGVYVDFSEPDKDNIWGFKPKWTVRLRLDELAELKILIDRDLARNTGGNY